MIKCPECGHVFESFDSSCECPSCKSNIISLYCINKDALSKMNDICNSKKINDLLDFKNGYYFGYLQGKLKYEESYFKAIDELDKLRHFEKENEEMLKYLDLSSEKILVRKIKRLESKLEYIEKENNNKEEIK